MLYFLCILVRFNRHYACHSFVLCSKSRLDASRTNICSSKTRITSASVVILIAVSFSRLVALFVAVASVAAAVIAPLGARGVLLMAAPAA